MEVHVQLGFVSRPHVLLYVICIKLAWAAFTGSVFAARELMGWCTDLACFGGLVGQATCCVPVSQSVARPGSYLIAAALVTLSAQRCNNAIKYVIMILDSFRLAC